MPEENSVKWPGFGLPADELLLGKTLDYETFTRTDQGGWPLYNNFPIFFAPTSTGDTYRKSPVWTIQSRRSRAFG